MRNMISPFYVKPFVPPGPDTCLLVLNGCNGHIDLWLEHIPTFIPVSENMNNHSLDPVVGVLSDVPLYAVTKGNHRLMRV